MDEKVKADHFPWLEGRSDPNVKPKYKIIARCMSLSDESIVMLHRAGSDYVINYSISDLVTHDDIMKDMDENEANLLRWVVSSENNDPLKEIKQAMNKS